MSEIVLAQIQLRDAVFQVVAEVQDLPGLDIKSRQARTVPIARIFTRGDPSAMRGRRLSSANPLLASLGMGQGDLHRSVSIPPLTDKATISFDTVPSAKDREKIAHIHVDFPHGIDFVPIKRRAPSAKNV